MKKWQLSVFLIVIVILAGLAAYGIFMLTHP